ncbi:MAG: hypothetical protein NTV01_18240 [Bacteroidia bacterium]|nr:hypothetical protein [Bacteroidia bacterium]
MIPNTKCNDVKNLIYLTEDEINPEEELLLSAHLASCSSCNEAREDFRAARAKTVQLKYEMPEYPDFKESTELLIKSHASLIRGTSVKNQFWQRTVMIARYASGIAAVFFLVLFISEQTISVHKISRLENRIQSTVNPSSPGLIDRLTLARSVFTGKEWTDLAEKLNVNQSVTDRRDILRIKNAFEKRMHSRRTGELAFMASLRSSLTIKRNVITFNNLFK